MNSKTILAAAMVAAISTGVVATAVTPVLAADAQAKAAEKTPEQKQSDEDLIKISEDAQITVRNVRGARLAIFNGMTEKAQVYTDAAATRAEAALKDVDKYALDIKQPITGDDEYVPFNASLAVGEGFEPTEAKMKHIAKANQHLHKGETKQAVEALKVGEIDVALTTELVPLKAAKAHIDDAAKLISTGKYYEANLALKAVEDSVLVESYGVDAVPKTKADHS